ncbi:MAG: tetratricopeptide repeat protein [Parachlamydiaceae bacterium]|nr:tetratricopeptide repeat protein [Parachlamydiaceae bacterium]
MDPQYLQAMMHGEIFQKKNEVTDPLGLAIDKQIDSEVDAMELEEDPTHKNMLSPKLRRKKIKMELKDAVRMDELSQLLESAVKLLMSEGPSYLSEKAYRLLVSEFSTIQHKIKNINLEQLNNVNMSSVVEISDESLNAIADVAAEKYSKELYLDCLSLYTLLSVLNSEQSEYWFRLAIAAQKFGNLDLATRAYTTAATLDPKHIGARLFAAECYIQRNLLTEAKAEFNAAEEIVRNNEIEKKWLDLLPLIKSLIQQ